VVTYLAEQGWVICERNFRTRWGEIDIVAKEGDELVFVEVKARSSGRFGTPEEAVNARKLRRMERVAEFYGMKHPKLPAKWRIDVVAVVVKGGNVREVRHIRNASGF